MREIKLRAWDELNKVTHHDFKFISSGNSGNDWVVFISDKYTLQNHKTNPFENPNPYFSKQLKKMQYTGLKDKNGVEIYEGDIINDYLIGICQVKYNEIHAAFKVVHKNTVTAKWFVDYLPKEFKYIEVIGNVYENPELLKC